MSNAGKPVTQRQLRVGEMIKQSLSMIFLKDEAKIPSINTKEITNLVSIRPKSMYSVLNSYKQGEIIFI